MLRSEDTCVFFFSSYKYTFYFSLEESREDETKILKYKVYHICVALKTREL